MKRLAGLIGIIGAIAMICNGSEADFSAAIDRLVPTLGSTNVPDRYGAQMELQKIVLDSGRPKAEAERKAMALALCKKVSDKSVAQPARVWLVRMLEYIGGDESVDTLTAIMKETDTELRECARRALEKNPSKSATASLRAMLQSETDVNMQIGLINSLGERADTASVDLIAKFLNDSKTATASALALGKIASEPAVAALFTVLNKLPTAGEALIEAGNKNLAGGNITLAKTIYQRLYENCEFIPVRGAALVGLAKADPQGAYKTVSDALINGDERLKRSAIAAIKEGYKDYSTRLMTLFPKLTTAAKVQILGVVDRSAEKEVIQSLKDSEQEVRVAGINALGRIGGADSVLALIALSAGDSQAEKSAAESALATISGSGVDSAIEKAALNGDVKFRVAAINAISTRRQVSSIPVLIKLIDDNNIEVKNAALKAIAKIGGDKEFEAIAKSAIQTKSKEAISALESIAQRLDDKASAAKKILNLIGNDKSALVSFINVLVAIGTDDCLKPISELVKSGDANSKEIALKALRDWQSFSAVQYLLPVATDSATEQSHYKLALNAITQIVRSAENEPVKSRADALLAVFNSARSDSDKKSVISAMATVPESRIAEVLKSLLKDEKFKQEAAQAGISVAEALAKTDRNTARQLASAIKEANINEELNKRASKIK